MQLIIRGATICFVICFLFVFSSPYAQTTETRYYCDDSRGYYPQVSTCKTPWRVVQVPQSAEAPWWRLYTVICTAGPCFGGRNIVTMDASFRSEAECRRKISPVKADPWGVKGVQICTTDDFIANPSLLNNLWFEELAAKYGSTAPKNAVPDNPPRPPYPDGNPLTIPSDKSPIAVIPFDKGPVWIDWAQVEKKCARHGFDCGFAGVFKAIRDRGMVPNSVRMADGPPSHSPPPYVPPGVIFRIGSNGWPAAVIPNDGGPVWIDWARIPGNCTTPGLTQDFCHGAGFFLAISERGMNR